MALNTPLDLSAREKECLQATSRGLVSLQIAAELGLSARTVDSHIANAMRKLSARTRTEAVACALRLGVLQ